MRILAKDTGNADIGVRLNRAARGKFLPALCSGLGVIYPTKKGKRKLTRFRIEGFSTVAFYAKTQSRQAAKKVKREKVTAPDPIRGIRQITQLNYRRVLSVFLSWQLSVFVDLNEAFWADNGPSLFAQLASK